MARLRAITGIRLIDVALAAVVAGAVELFITTASGPGQRPLNAEAYLFGAVMAMPVLFRRRWPLRVLIACSILLIVFYTTDRRNIPPTPLLSLPVYDAAVAGYLLWAIGIPVFFIAAGLLLVAVSSHHGPLALGTEFVPRLAGVPVFFLLLPVMTFPLAVALGELVRGRRALAAETAHRLRAAEDEREAEAARRVAEERLRIARELHDTVAHSMATITVQAGSALHLLGVAAGDAGRDAKVRAALAAIRGTSKSALSEMRAALGQLRQPGAADGAAGLGRLPALRDAVVAAGLPVAVTIEGTQLPLPRHVDHAAYRIVQESLTNVLKHASPDASAAVRIRYGTAALTLEVTDDGGDAGQAPAAGDGAPPGRPRGHGLAGMAERAAAVGGELTAGPRPGGGFAVTARLPLGGGNP